MISQSIKRQRKFNSTRVHLKIAQSFTSLRGRQSRNIKIIYNF